MKKLQRRKPGLKFSMDKPKKYKHMIVTELVDPETGKITSNSQEKRNTTSNKSQKISQNQFA
jgi:hypothetical protein